MTDYLDEVLDLIKQKAEAEKNVSVKDGYILIKSHDTEIYEIEVDECREPVDLCRRIFHLLDRNGYDLELVRQFAKVALEATGNEDVGDLE
jgi:hypothetical protein